MSGPDTPETRKLYCYLLGDRNAFSVIVNTSDTVEDLRKAISNQISSQYRGASVAHNLTLFQTRFDDGEDLHQKAQEALEHAKMELNVSSSLIRTIFPQPPSSTSVSIVVQAPQPEKTNITPSSSQLDTAIITDQVDTELALIRPKIEVFLKHPELKTWDPNLDPKSKLDAKCKDFFARLKIPIYEDNQMPSLLLHGLDNLQPNFREEIQAVFGRASGRQPLCICNTSGSGKTRRILEILTIFWGFYIVPKRDNNGIGVTDLETALDKIAKYQEWKEDLQLLPPEQRDAQSNTNKHIIMRTMSKVVAARVAVFELFLEVAVQIDGQLLEKHKRLWMFFQLFDSLPHQEALSHPFNRIISKLDGGSDQAVEAISGRLNSIVTKYFDASEHLIIALDEAQQASRLYPRCSMSSSERGKYRSILRDLSTVLTRLRMKYLPSGTGISLADLQDRVASGTSKPVSSIKLFSDLGMFDCSSLRTFLSRHLPNDILESYSGVFLQQGLREYLLGRYRLSVSFLELLMKNSLQSPNRLLDKYVRAHLPMEKDLKKVHYDKRVFESEPEVELPIEIQTFEWDRLKKDDTAIRDAVAIVQAHILQGHHSTYGEATERLVEYGIARLRLNPSGGSHKGEITEALPFLSVVRWLEMHNHLKIEAVLRRLAGDQDFRGPTFERIMIYYLFRMLRFPIPADEVFDFHPGHTPSWAGEKIQILARRNRQLVPVDLFGTHPENPGLACVHYASTIEEVLGWLEGPNSPAVLVSNNQFGPDFLCYVSEDTVAMGQFKSYTRGNIETLDAKTLTDAFGSLHQSHWFKSESLIQRQKLIDAFARRRILRFVSGYPLVADVNSKANSVTNCLAGFDPQSAIASMNINEFRTYFQSKEFDNVIIPLEAALKLKRKADQMS